jgi:glycosyltransferase involved in cell wall biosynthesis
MNLLLFNLRTDADDTTLGFTTAWVNALARRCERVTVITMQTGRVDVAPNVTVHSLGKERGYSEPRRLFEFYRLCLRELRSQRFDACFAHMTPLFALMFAPLAKLWRIPILLWYAHKSVPKALRAAHPLVDRCVASTPEGFRLRSDKVFFIGQGIDTAAFAPPEDPAPGRDMTAVSVGRISAIKRLDEIVEALARLRADGVDLRLVLAGEPNTEADAGHLAELRRRVAALGLDGAIEFRGAIPFHQVGALYREGGLFINLSESGSLDKAILESMASGCIPICRNDAFRALAAQEGIEQLVPGAGAEAVAACTRSVLALAPEEQERLRAQLRGIVVRDHSLDVLSERVLGHLSDLVRREAGAPPACAPGG